jgi:hypothetical protein
MTEKKKIKLYKILFSLSIALFISSAGLKFYLCNIVTVKNGEFDQASIKKAELKKELEALRVEQSSLSSMENIEERSRELGFVEMEERLLSVDLDAPVQVALINSE